MHMFIKAFQNKQHGQIPAVSFLCGLLRTTTNIAFRCNADAQTSGDASGLRMVFCCGLLSQSLPYVLVCSSEQCKRIVFDNGFDISILENNLLQPIGCCPATC